MKLITNITLGAALIAGAFSVTYAGPSPEFVLRRLKSDAGAVAEKPSAHPACARCTDDSLWEVRRDLPNGRSTPRLAKVGTRHACTACGGAITIRKGVVDDQMHQNCQICASTSTACCRTPNDRPAS